MFLPPPLIRTCNKLTLILVTEKCIKEPGAYHLQDENGWKLFELGPFSIFFFFFFFFGGGGLETLKALTRF